jgi:hypothetical protein
MSIILIKELKMPQISLYIDEETLRKVENEAKRSHLSISKWVAEQIREKIEPHYPQGYENLFGSVSDESFKRPDSISFSEDSSRESF